MRDLKFRAWNIIVKRFQFFELTDIEKEKGKIQWDILKIDQFTGLTDKNGVDIYYGDIRGYQDDDSIAIVVFDRGAACLKYTTWDDDTIPTRIDTFHLENSIHLGNIHENSELL